MDRVVIAAEKLHLPQLDGEVREAKYPDQHENPDNCFQTGSFHTPPLKTGSRFKVRGSRFEVRGSRFKVQGSRFKLEVRG
jgi:hypothetical protein